MRVLVMCGLDIPLEKEQVEDIIKPLGYKYEDLDITIINPSEDVIKDGIFKNRIKSTFQDYKFNDDEKFDIIISSHCFTYGEDSLFTKETFKTIYNLLNKDGILILDNPYIIWDEKEMQWHPIYQMYYIDPFTGLNILACIRYFFEETRSGLNEKSMSKYIFRKKEISEDEKRKGEVCFL